MATFEHPGATAPSGAGARGRVPPLLLMRVSELLDLVDDEFGRAYGRSLAADQVLLALRDRAPVQALDAGVEPKAVWLALCDAMDVPSSAASAATGAAPAHPLAGPPAAPAPPASSSRPNPAPRARVEHAGAGSSWSATTNSSVPSAPPKHSSPRPPRPRLPGAGCRRGRTP